MMSTSLFSTLRKLLDHDEPSQPDQEDQMAPTDGKPERRVVVVPCSGIGKAFGTISREAAYIAFEELRPEVADTVCLSLLVMGDEEARGKVQRQPTVTVDGCAKECARKNVELAGGSVSASLRVVDTFRRHHDLKATGISELAEPGRKLAHILAEEIAGEVGGIREAARW